jgi:hypothetical protein
MAGRYDMNIDQGSDYRITLTIKDELGAAINLTGQVFSGQIRRTASDVVILASFTFNVLPQAGLTLGQVEVLLPGVTSSSIPVATSKSATRTPTIYCYDIESTSFGVTTRWIEGLVTINPEVTK